MARNPIEIGIASETKAFRQGVDSGVIAPLEDAVQALDDLGRSRGPEGLERDMEAAQKTTKKVADETKKTADAIEREFGSSYQKGSREADKFGDKNKTVARDIERDYKDGFQGAADSADDGLSRMGQRGEEIGGELRQNLGETFASFRGDLEDLPQIAQDTLGGLAGSGALGGIAGLAATAAGAAGLGLIIGAFERINEENEASQVRIGEWAQAYIDAGSQVLGASQTLASAQGIITDPEKWQEAQRNAEMWGVSVSTAVLAQAGHAASMDVVSVSLDKQKDAYARSAAGVTENYEAREKELARLAEAEGAYQRLTSEMEQGRVRADVLSQSLVNVAATTAGATTTVDEFGDKVVSLPDGKQIYIDAETGQATDATDAIEKKIFGIQGKTVDIKVRVDSTAWDNWKPSLKTGAVATATTGRQVT